MKTPRHRDGTPETTCERHGLIFKIDRHDGTVHEGTGPDGKPFHIVQKGDYGYVHGFPGEESTPPKGDDGEGWDAYLGPDHKADRVYVVTQRNAYNGRYDEQKGLFGFSDAQAAEQHYRDHVHPTMFGRIGGMSLKSFHEQLRAHTSGVFRAETEEDEMELKAMDELEAEMNAAPEDLDGPDSE